MISASTRLLAVIGQPVRHSLSPVLQNIGIAALGKDWCYLALEVSADRLGDALTGLDAIGAIGVNVTIPHKQAVMPLLAEVTPLARRIGAVNTLYRLTDGRWGGTNTDVEGFIAPLRPDAERFRGGTAVILGNGGSARAVVAAVLELGCRRILVAGRNVRRLGAFVSHCRGWAPGLEGLAWEALQGQLRQAALVVNCTPVGMHPDDDSSPLDPGCLDALQAGSCVYDLIYVPRPTRLLQQATAHGCDGQDGLEMLVQQGAAALRIWSGCQQVDSAAMREGALQALAARGGQGHGQAVPSEPLASGL